MFNCPTIEQAKLDVVIFYWDSDKRHGTLRYRMNIEMIDKTQHRKGILLISCSLLAFGLMQIFVAKTGPEIPIVEQVFFRNLIGMMVAGFFVQRKKISLKVIRSHVRPLLARSIAG